MRGLVDVEEPGRYRFTHALVRDAIYDGLAAPARARAHAAVALALEDRYAGRLLDHVGELAEHYRLAGPAHVRSAWVFARRAAQAAAAQSAHDEALRLHGEAASLQELDPTVTGSEREATLVGRSEAMMRLGRPIEAWPVVAAAAESALERDDVEAAARDPADDHRRQRLGLAHPGLLGRRRDLAVVPRPRTGAFRRCGPPGAAGGAGLRAPLQAWHAGAGHRARGCRRGRVRDEGTGTPPGCACSGWPSRRCCVPICVHHRLTLHDEMIELATELGDSAVLASSLATRAADRADLLRLDATRADLDRAEQLARQHRLPQNLLIIGWSRSTLQQMEGDLAGADAALGELEAMQATLAMAGEGIGLCQRAVLRLVDGRLPELEPALRAAAPYYPLFRELHALALVEAGRLDEARVVIGPWADQPEPPWDYLWTTYVAVRALVWSALGDQVAVAALREALQPYADRAPEPCPSRSSAATTRCSATSRRPRVTPRPPASTCCWPARPTRRPGLELWVARSEASLAAL